ncbi:MAG: hypothetical protein KKB51_05480, partial [Candidatus Riflebacteria bacterium]|nr:hypothetical protein [Candidatus Riflebacteria bacterium]
MRSKLIFCLLGLALIATMALTGCFGSSSDGDNYVPVSGTTIKGSISTVATSMRADLKAVVAPTSAVISFNYIDANGNPVPLVSGINVTFNGTTATYEFSVNIPLAALQYRNFLLIATPNVGDPIEGIIPFDPTGETAVTAPPINPNDAGPVAFVKLMAKAGTPNVGMGDVLSIYTPADIKAMINTANMTTLVARFKEREQAMEQMRTEFSAQATNIQKLMNYSAQLARDPEYMGFDNREKFEAAMKAKAAELGLPYDAMAAIDAMESQFIGSGLPTPASQPALNFDNLSNASEQKRELESLNLALQYFAGVLNNGDLNTIRSRFMTAADAFFAQIMTGNPPQPGTTNHPFFILDEAREIIFTQLGTVVKGVILVKPADMQTLGQLGATATPEQIIANKKALFALVIGRINAEYANLTGAPTAAAEKEKFIQALAALTSIVMAGVNDQPVQPGTVGNTTISGSISATTNASMRAVVVPPTSATVNFCYLDANGNPVTIMTGFVITFTGNVANYEFKVNIPAAALQYRNFLLIATPNTGDPIEGVIPFDPNSETNITAPAIDPNDAGPVAFVKLMAKAGAPNVGMGDVLSIYTPADLKAMIETANMTTLVAKFQEREQAMEQMKTEFSAQATNIQELMNYSAQLARDPE